MTRPSGAQLPGHLEQGGPRHANVHEQHVCPGRVPGFEPSFAGRRLSDNLHIGAFGDDALQSLTHDRTVVGDEQSDHAVPRVTRTMPPPRTECPVEPNAGATGRSCTSTTTSGLPA